VELQAKSVLAELGVGGKVRGFGVALSGQASIAHSTIGDQGSVVRPAREITTSHTEARGEGFVSRGGLVTRSSAEKVVDGQTTGVYHAEGAIGPAVVEVRVPIHRVVDLLNGTSRAGRGEELLVDRKVGVILGEGAKTIGTADSVSVVAYNPGLHEGIDTTPEQGLALAKDFKEGIKRGLILAIRRR
jgi:hypothetical protein